MKRLVVVAGCLFAAFAAAPALSAPGVPCGPASAHTLAASSGVRVYSQLGSVYGCAPGRRGVQLGSATICNGRGRAGPAAAAVRLAAYALERCGVDTGSAEVIVRRFTDGKQLLRQAAWTLSVGPESYVSVGSIVVDRAGDVAWIASMTSIVSDRHEIEVAKFAGHEVRTLDSGAGIAPGSLRLRERALTWRHGTGTRSATLG